MTLVEMLLSVTLFSTLMAAVAGLLRSGVQAQLGWGQTIAPYQHMERAFQRFERDLASAQPFFGLPFLGDAQGVEGAMVEDGEWVRIRYRLEDAPDGLWMVRETSGWRVLAEGAPPTRREPLVRLAQGAFAFGMVDAQGQLVWVSAWDGERYGAPRFIKFDGALPVGGNQPTLALSRVFRNPAGSLPVMQENP